MLEKKKHTAPFLVKRLFKLIYVLYSLKKDEDPDDIWQTIQQQKAQERDDMTMGNESQMNTSMGGILSEKEATEFHLSLNRVNKDATHLDKENSNYQTTKAFPQTTKSFNSSKKEIRNSSMSPKMNSSVNFNQRKTSHDRQTPQNRGYADSLYQNKQTQQKQMQIKENYQGQERDCSYGFSDDLQDKNILKVKSNKNLFSNKIHQQPLRENRPVSSGSHAHLHRRREPMQTNQSSEMIHVHKSRPFSSN